MPEHVHLLLTEPERSSLAVALQMLKQNVAHKVPHPPDTPLWQPRYNDFNVWSSEKRVEKLKSLHRNRSGGDLSRARKAGSGAATATTPLGSME